MVELGNDWQQLLQAEFEKEYYLELRQFLIAEYRAYNVYPDMHNIFNALKFSSYKDTKVVILAQDPYHGRGQAHGLCFSVQEGTPHPPSLVNIFKELNADLGIPAPKSGNLSKWAKQGVLLLNTTLTVREGCPMSHTKKGWETLTDKIFALLNERAEGMVFMLWGAHAKSKTALITNPAHYILAAPHPSPLSAFAGFFGCRHFSRANEILQDIGKVPIDWDLNNGNCN